MRKSHQITKQELIDQSFEIRQVIASASGTTKIKRLECVVRPQDNSTLYRVTLTELHKDGNNKTSTYISTNFEAAVENYNDLYEIS